MNVLGLFINPKIEDSCWSVQLGGTLVAPGSDFLQPLALAQDLTSIGAVNLDRAAFLWHSESRKRIDNSLARYFALTCCPRRL